MAGPVFCSGNEGWVRRAGLENPKWAGFTRWIASGRAERPTAKRRWPTSGGPEAYALRREILERIDGLDDVAFPICGEEFELGERVAALGLDRVVVREARVRHHRHSTEDSSQQLVRSTLEHGPLVAQMMARSRVRVHRRYSHGLARYTMLLFSVPLWALVSVLACLGVRAPLGARLRTVRAIAAGVAEGYKEALPS